MSAGHRKSKKSPKRVRTPEELLRKSIARELELRAALEGIRDGDVGPSKAPAHAALVLNILAAPPPPCVPSEVPT